MMIVAISPRLTSDDTPKMFGDCGS